MRSTLIPAVALVMLLGCRTDYVVADRDTGSDASAVDSGRGDGGLDASGDSGVPLDASDGDTALDAAIDTALDAAIDTSLDAPADAPADAPDAAPDAADASDGTATDADSAA